MRAVNKVQITKEPISDESLPIKTAYRPLKMIEMSASCHKATLLEVHLITWKKPSDQGTSVIDWSPNHR